MARINLEEEFFADPRLQQLCVKHPLTLAVGSVVCLWKLGQSYWRREGSLIPREIFQMTPLADDLVACGFAEIREEGVYCRGAEQRWSFLLRAQKAGRASAKARQQRYGTTVPVGATNHVKFPELKPNKRRTKAEQVPNMFELAPNTSEQARANPEQLRTTPNNSEPSSSSSSSFKNYSVGGEASPSPNGARDFIAAYIRAYQRTYGAEARPPITGKVAGQVKRLLADVPLERAIALVEMYLTMDDPWFRTKAHDITTFSENLTKIAVRLDTGFSGSAAPTPTINLIPLNLGDL